MRASFWAMMLTSGISHVRPCHPRFGFYPAILAQRLKHFPELCRGLSARVSSTSPPVHQSTSPPVRRAVALASMGSRSRRQLIKQRKQPRRGDTATRFPYGPDDSTKG